MTTRRTLLQAAALGTVRAVCRAADLPFALPKLPYSYDSLEPYIDAQTMQIHHDKHHQAYVDNLNQAVSGEPELAKLSVVELLQRLDTLPPLIRTQVRNHGGGHANHSLFWQTLAPASKSGQPGGKLANAISQAFGSHEKLEESLRTAAAGVFGSGWAWLCVGQHGKLSVVTTPNQDTPLSAGSQPILGIDVWEHAYYLKYQNRRPEYLAAVFHVVNWSFVSERFAEMTA